MSPPIRDGSGSSIGSIRLGDGTEISEVRTGAGDVLFSGNAIPDSGVARYTLDSADISSGTVTDVWKNNGITLNGGTTGQSGLSTQYDSGESVQFDGSDDYMESSNALLDGLNSWSIALWADYDGSEKGWLMAQKDDYNNFGIFNETVNNNLEIYYAGGNQISVNGDVSSTGEHIVVTYDGSTIELYRDGSGVNTSSVSSSMSNSTGFYYGVRSGLVEYHNGNEDDIRLYDKSLTSTKISNLYNTGSI